MTIAPKKPLARRVFRGIAILAILGMLGIGVLLGSLWVEHRTEITLPAPSLRAVLVELERRHPALHRSVCDETGAVRQHVNLFVNTDHMRDRNGLDTPLMPGDAVTILPAISGG